MKTKKNQCPFCTFTENEAIIYSDEACFAIISKNPINKYHILIIPKQHFKRLTTLPDSLVMHLMLVIKRLSIVLTKVCHPDAINYVFDDDITNTGINLVSHFKIHIIPRFKRDLDKIDWGVLRNNESDLKRYAYAGKLRKKL